MIIAHLLFVLSLLFSGIALAGSPIHVEVDISQSTLTVGEPLVIEMRVTNIDSGSLGPFFIYSSNFSLTFYQGDTVEGCELLIAPAEPVGPLPPRPPLFAFVWPIAGLQPGQSTTCRVTYTQTLYSGQETITLSSIIGGTIFWPDLAEFTYTLLPKGRAPQPVPLHSRNGLLLMALMLLLLGCRQLRARRW